VAAAAAQDAGGGASAAVTEGVAAGAWACERCTFLHDSAESRCYLACELCGLERRH